MSKLYYPKSTYVIIRITIKGEKMIQKRNIVAVYLLSIITLGIYGIYWEVKTKDEINSLGGDIPTAWLIIVPIANIYWLYKYADSFSNKVKKDKNDILWFIVFWLIAIIMPAIVQSELNKIADKKAWVNKNLPLKGRFFVLTT